MKTRWLSCVAATFVIALSAACDDDGAPADSGSGGTPTPAASVTGSTPTAPEDTPPAQSTGEDGPSTTTTPFSNGTATTLHIIVTNDGSRIDIEDEELSPILDRISPTLANLLANSGLPPAEVSRVGPRTIVIQIEGVPQVILPQVQELVDQGNFEIPLLVTQLAQ